MKKLKAAFLNFEELLCVVFFAIMVGVASLNVIARYIPGFSFAASEETVVNLFVWLTMIGAIVAVKENAHISITSIIRKFPEKYQNIFIIIRWIAVFLLFFILMLYGAIETWSEYRSGMMTYSLGWPIWVFTLSLPVGSLLFMIRFSIKIFKEFKRAK